MLVSGRPPLLVVGSKRSETESWMAELDGRGLSIEWVEHGAAALEALARSHHAVTLIPSVTRDGLGASELGRALRRLDPQTAIVLIGRGWDRDERHRLIEEFADAYLTEDTPVDELAALLMALDRRAGGARTSCSMRWKSLEIDFIGGLVAIDGREIALQPLQLRILGCLIQHSGRTVTREQLRHEVFRATRIGSTCIARQISVLRRQLGPVGAEIKTVPGGYGLGIAFVQKQVGPVNARTGRTSPMAGCPGVRRARSQSA
jgi:DNA-binding response OmpR family regulator